MGKSPCTRKHADSRPIESVLQNLLHMRPPFVLNDTINLELYASRTRFEVMAAVVPDDLPETSLQQGQPASCWHVRFTYTPSHSHCLLPNQQVNCG